ncbi:hypothetical protein BO70DRAFT_398124 [Aspergillus heteromorphus CBS 117.55]|uniref:ABM domain-containing protein n=1 Tax=Aspergillus heteromorphus CBS 117.55 TaxID=1448321 RepID=A0A317VTB1_9EURO|nr:uncharacterized protein BO70DRAFT_398124 [Aspergillus heteromorphus CBS 117.55]PWY76257.1 hypothetical protein BO70DRAFT_398124 [Aspergillus heteromorphus CBS 117.55]
MAFNPRPGFTIQVSLFIAPENMEKFHAAFQPMYEKTIAEPQCVFSEACQSAKDPGKFCFDGVLERAMRDYIKEYAATVEPLFARPREFKLLHRLEGFHHAKRYTAITDTGSIVILL